MTVPHSQTTKQAPTYHLTSEAMAARQIVPVPTLTIAYHPDLHRVGEQVKLGEFQRGRPVRVSRNKPLFRRPGSSKGAALNDLFLSREPFFIRHLDRVFELQPKATRTHIVVGGELVTGPRRFGTDEVDRGVFIELGQRVVLLFDRQLSYQEEGSHELGIVGNSVGIRRVRDEIRRVAGDDAPILIRGETGVGKELVAQAIHRLSNRATHDVVCVNTATLWPSLAASALFGVRRGAFTGASHDQPGYFQQANRSTLFLDEIGEIPREVQPMLLRALDNHEVIPVGGQRAEPVDVRLVTATDADLDEMVRVGRFRKPLLHRLAGYEIVVPPLRERRSDIAPLMVHFLTHELKRRQAGDRLRASDDGQPWLPLDVAMRFLQFDWPGNVRELRKAVESLVLASYKRSVAVLPPALERKLGARSMDRRDVEHQTTDPDGLVASPVRPERPVNQRGKRRLTDISDAELLRAGEKHRYVYTAMAAELGIARNSLYRRIEESPDLRFPHELSHAEMKACHDGCDGDIDQMVMRLRVSKHALRRRLKELGLT